MDEIRVSAKTVDDALTEALIQLRTTSDQVEYEIIEKGTSGFLGIGAKQAVINVRRKKPEKKEYKPEEKTERFEKKAEKAEKVFEKAEKAVKKADKIAEKTAEKETEEKKEEVNKVKAEQAEALPEKKEKAVIELSEEEAGEILNKANQFLSDIFKAMNMEVQINAEVDKNSRLLNIDLSGDNMGILIGKHGQNLNSLEYLVRLVINKNHHGDEYIHVKLDTENYRRRRKNTLEILAKNMAYKVKRTKRNVVLEPMNPYERRVIHSALQHDRFVETHSEGTEPNRRVVITLKRY